MKVTTKTVEQASLINTALGGDFQAISWRNHPGDAPDGQYVWWNTGPTNFGKSPTPICRLLDQGRGEPDPAKRKTIYENVNKLFGEQALQRLVNWTSGTSPRTRTCRASSVRAPRRGRQALRRSWLPGTHSGSGSPEVAADRGRPPG